MGLLRNVARKLLGRDKPSTPVTPATSAPAPQEPVADGEALATLEAGAQEVKERLDAGEAVVLLDVREPFETQGGIIPGAKMIPLGQLPARWEELKNCNEIVCYCAAGARSYGAATFLREKGLFNATSMEGGIAAWAQLGGKVAPP
jgi:rhodanese-related sulfurtransferase